MDKHIEKQEIYIITYMLCMYVDRKKHNNTNNLSTYLLMYKITET